MLAKGKRHPSLIEMHPNFATQFSIRNAPLTAHDLSGGSNKKVWWECPNGHDHQFLMEVVRRVSKEDRCSVCSGYVVCEGFNDLASQRPDIARLFSLKLNEIAASEVMVSSKKRVWWECQSCSYEWEQDPQELTRTDGKAVGCPCCGGRRTHAGCSDLATTHPELASEWSPKNELSPQEVRRGSRERIVWCCSTCSHEWETPVKERARTKTPSGCPKCCTFRTSKIEQVFREALKSVLPDLRDDQNSYVLAGRKYQVDVLADWNGKQVAVEYDGELFHGTYYDPLKPAKDVKKTEDLLTAGFLVVRIREGKLPFVPVSHPHLLQVPFKHRRQQVPDASILDVVAQVETWLRSL